MHFTAICLSILTAATPAVTGLSTLAPATPVVNGGLFQNSSPKVWLNKLIQDQVDQRVAVTLDIIGEQAGDVTAAATPRLAIKDIVFDLLNDLPSEQHVKMPGFNGSAGLRRLNLVKEGSFISHLGQKFVKAVNGCWELDWKENANSGSLICGVELPEDYERNGATLSKGKIYITFPLWHRETLKKMQNQKDRIMSRANAALQEKEDELTKMQATGNILQKMLHYRNAHAAHERFHVMPKKQYQTVPSNDEVLSFQGDELLVTTKGTVWADNFLSGKQIMLGAASLKLAPTM